MSQQIRGQGRRLDFPISLKYTNLVEDIEILLPVKFCWILFSSFRGEVENVSANQRPERPSCFSDQPKKDNFGKGTLISCFLSSFHSAVPEEKSKMWKVNDNRQRNSALEPNWAFGSGAQKTTLMNKKKWNFVIIHNFVIKASSVVVFDINILANTTLLSHKWEEYPKNIKVKIVAAFWGMHVSPAKHSFGKCNRQTDRQSDPYVSLCFAGDTNN